MKLLCCYLSVVLALGSFSRSFGAQSTKHMVSAIELRQTLVTQSAQREGDVAEIRTLLDDETVRDQLRGVANLDEIKASIANLDDETLRELGDRARTANRQVSAGGNTKLAVCLVVAIIVGSILLNLIPRDY